jgi:putative oxidoreductase
VDGTWGSESYDSKENTWNILLLMIRLWLGASMIMSGQSILRFFSSQELRDFFVNWFGTELGFPAPLLMAFLAKGTEFTGGILLCLGFLTRVSATMVGFVMLVATLTANLNFTGDGPLILQDGFVTISNFLFAGVFVIWGGGKYSLDGVVFKGKHKLIQGRKPAMG